MLFFSMQLLRLICSFHKYFLLSPWSLKRNLPDRSRQTGFMQNLPTKIRLYPIITYKEESVKLFFENLEISKPSRRFHKIPTQNLWKIIFGIHKPVFHSQQSCGKFGRIPFCRQESDWLSVFVLCLLFHDAIGESVWKLLGTAASAAVETFSFRSKRLVSSYFFCPKYFPQMNVVFSTNPLDFFHNLWYTIIL